MAPCEEGGGEEKRRNKIIIIAFQATLALGGPGRRRRVGKGAYEQMLGGSTCGSWGIASRQDRHISRNKKSRPNKVLVVKTKRN